MFIFHILIKKIYNIFIFLGFFIFKKDITIPSQNKADWEIIKYYLFKYKKKEKLF